jgi:hypothetical protein
MAILLEQSSLVSGPLKQSLLMPVYGRYAEFARVASPRSGACGEQLADVSVMKAAFDERASDYGRAFRTSTELVIRFARKTQHTCVDARCVQ